MGIAVLSAEYKDVFYISIIVVVANEHLVPVGIQEV